jgi:hypothetical protein
MLVDDYVRYLHPDRASAYRDGGIDEINHIDCPLLFDHRR